MQRVDPVQSPEAALQGCVPKTLPPQHGAIGPMSSHLRGKKGQPLSLLGASSSPKGGPQVLREAGFPGVK